MDAHCRTLAEILSRRVTSHVASFRAKTFLYDAAAVDALERALVVEMRELAKRFLSLQTAIDGLSADKTSLQHQLDTLTKDHDDLVRQCQAQAANMQRQLHQSRMQLQMQAHIWERDKKTIKGQCDLDAAEERQAALDRVLRDAAVREERLVRRLEEDKTVEMDQMRRHFALQRETELAMVAHQISRRAHQDVELKIAAITADVQQDQLRKHAKIQQLERALRDALRQQPSTRPPTTTTPSSIAHAL